jgi:hypothetical protein
MTKTTIASTPAISKHLLDGASMILNSVSKPSHLLSFMTDMIGAINVYGHETNKRKESAIFYPLRIIDYIIHPWDRRRRRQRNRNWN